MSIELINKPVKKRKSFWYGWVKDAMKTFNIGRTAVIQRYNIAEPNLIEWLNSELERRNQAKLTKTRIEKENTGTD